MKFVGVKDGPEHPFGAGPSQQDKGCRARGDFSVSGDKCGQGDGKRDDPDSGWVLFYLQYPFASKTRCGQEE